jgi:GGDEF domain-containing protein
VSLSIGWAVPERGETLLAAFARADRAMYEAKRSTVSVPEG